MKKMMNIDEDSNPSMQMSRQASDFAPSLNGDIVLGIPQVKFDQKSKRNAVYRKVTTEDGITIVSTKTAKHRSQVRVKSPGRISDIVDADYILAN